jgi:hypothetical protein
MKKMLVLLFAKVGFTSGSFIYFVKSGGGFGFFLNERVIKSIMFFHGIKYIVNHGKKQEQRG